MLHEYMQTSTEICHVQAVHAATLNTTDCNNLKKDQQADPLVGNVKFVIMSEIQDRALKT